MSSLDLGNVRSGTGSEEEGRRGGAGGWRDYCPPRAGGRERGAVCRARCKTRGIRRAARLINRVLSSSNWQSSNNHLEAPPVNPELILGVTVRRHSYHSARIQSSARSLLSSSRPGEKASFAFFGRVFAFPLRRCSPLPYLPAYIPSPLSPLRLRYLIPCPRLHLIWIFSIAR